MTTILAAIFVFGVLIEKKTGIPVERYITYTDWR